MENDSIIGIDLGTTNSCACLYPEKIIAAPNGERTIPSVIGFPDPKNENKILVGKDAIKNNNIKKIPLLYDSKRFIGRTIDDPIIKEEQKFLSYKIVKDPNGDKVKLSCNVGGNKKLEFYPEEVSAEILKQIKRNAEKFFNKKINRAVITVPAYFNNSQRESTKKAGEIAGFKVERIINEPTAAALAYGLNEYKKNEDNEDDDDDDGEKKEKKILVFDLGGGTFDVSILSIEKEDKDESFIVIGTGGNNHLGGRDFDKIIYELILEEIDYRITDIKLSNSNERYDYLIEKKEELLKNEKKFMELCEKYKIQLSEPETYEINNVLDLDISIFRSNFETKLYPFIKECMDIVQKTLKTAKVKEKQISHIILIGGSTKIPIIKDELGKMFDNSKIYDSINPDEAVAIGASIQAAIIQNIKSDNIMNTFLFDSTPLDLGLEVKEKNNAQKKMGIIIPRNTKIPHEKIRTINTTKDNQQNATIKIFEGNFPEVEKNHFLGKFTLTNLPLKPAGEVKMKLIYKIDNNSILTVTAQDISNPDNVKDIKIININSTLSDEDVKKLKTKSEKYIYDDNENIIYNICKLRKNYKNDLNDGKKIEILNKIIPLQEKLISLINLNFNDENNETLIEKYFIYTSYLFKEFSLLLAIKSISHADIDNIQQKIKLYVDTLLNNQNYLTLNDYLELISNFINYNKKNENLNQTYIFILSHIFDNFSQKGIKLFKEDKYDESYKLLNIIIQQIEIKFLGKNQDNIDEKLKKIYEETNKYNNYLSSIYLRKKHADKLYETSIKGDYVNFESIELLIASYIAILLDNKENIIKNINDDCLEKIVKMYYIKTGIDGMNKDNAIDYIKKNYINNLNEIKYEIKNKNHNQNDLFDSIEKFTKKIMDFNITEGERIKKKLTFFENEKNAKNAKNLLRAIQKDFQSDKNSDNFKKEINDVFQAISSIANEFEDKLKSKKK
jgi:molecular chaperone DnaK (HSP70)